MKNFVFPKSKLQVLNSRTDFTLLYQNIRPESERIFERPLPAENPIIFSQRELNLSGGVPARHSFATGLKI